MASVNDHESKLKRLWRSSLNDTDYNTLDIEARYHGYKGLTNAYSNDISCTDVLVYSPDWIVQKQYIIGSNGYYTEAVRTRHDGITWSKWRKSWMEGDRITNAVWNDYAEFFERGCETEVGDIIALNPNSEKEEYIKSWEGCTNCVGVHSDSYGMLIGGKESDGKDFLETNIDNYIPVGLVGRVKTKIIGCINKGDRVVPSHINGVGRKYNKNTDDIFSIIGMAVENKDTNEIGLVKVALGGGDKKLSSKRGDLSWLV